MACRQTLRSGLLLRSVGLHKVVAAARNNLQPMVVGVNQLSRHLPLSVNSAIQVSSFHTTCSKQNEHIINIQDENDFKTRVLTNSKPVIVDFFATWCGPCKLLIPRLESLGAVKDGKAILAKIDIDEMPDLAGNYGVEAVPTVLAMKDGKIIDKFVGLKDDAALQTFVDKLTAGK